MNKLIAALVAATFAMGTAFAQAAAPMANANTATATNAVSTPTAKHHHKKVHKLPKKAHKHHT